MLCKNFYNHLFCQNNELHKHILTRRIIDILFLIVEVLMTLGCLEYYEYHDE